MTRRALVTGSEGFTGRYVCAALRAAGWNVWGTGVRPDAQTSNYVACELTEPKQVASLVAEVKPDLVVHLAGIAFVAHGDPSAFYQVNVIGTRNLLAALASSDHKPRCVILASSANVYGNSTEGVLGERTPPNPANDYAVSKLAMEFMARLWRDQLPIVITRPFNYTGRGQDSNFLIPKIVKHFRERAPTIELGNLDVERDFSDVRDVAKAYVTIAENCPAGETVNLCSGRCYALRDVLNMACEISGHLLEIRVNPAFVRNNEVRVLQGDRSHLEALVGYWKPVTLADTLEWMLKDT